MKINICPNCMIGEFNENDICEYCTKGGVSENEAPFLPIYTEISHRYILGKSIDNTDEYLSYLAYDTKEKRPVILKELFVKDLCTRNGEEVAVSKENMLKYKTISLDFKELYQSVSKFEKLDFIEKVYDVLFFNKTIYAVCKIYEGTTLQEYTDILGGKIAIGKSSDIIKGIAETLQLLHKNGIIHGGLNPKTIVFDRKGNVILKDFIVTKPNIEGNSAISNYDKIFLAPEQMSKNSMQGFYTDIYSLVVCFYVLLTGELPQFTQKDSEIKVNVDFNMLPNDLPANIKELISKSLSTDVDKRPKSVREFINLLNNDSYAAVKTENIECTENIENTEKTKNQIKSQKKAEYLKNKSKAKKQKRKNNIIFALVSIITIIILSVSVAYVLNLEPVDPTEPEPAAASEAEPEPATEPTASVDNITTPFRGEF